MKWKKTAAVLLALAVAASALAGCAAQETQPVSEAVEYPENDGSAASLTLAGVGLSEGRLAVLEEIAGKYRADFPNTQIAVRSFETADQVKEALRSGEADIGQVESFDLPSWAKEGLLADIYPAGLETWDERSTLTAAAKQAVYFMGAERCYAIPFDFNQDMLFYRSDRFDAYNEGREKDLARCRSWDEIAGGVVAGQTLIGAAEKLGEEGKLAFAGKDKLPLYFDAILWSALSQGYISSSSAGYFSAVKNHVTVFSLDQADEGVKQFSRVLNASLPEALDWTENQAVEAFAEGKASMLLASRSAASVLKDALGEGTWDVAAFPRGLLGSAVFTDEFSGWGVSAKAQSPEIARHFLLYLSNGDNNTHFAKECGTLPIHLDALGMEDSLLEGNRAVEADMIKHGDWYRYVGIPVMYEACGQWRQAEDEALRRFIAGGISQQELLEELDAYWSGAFQTEGKLW